MQSLLLSLRRMKKLLLIIFVCLPFLADGKGWNADWYSSVRLAGTSGQYMPFWARTGEDGLLSVNSSALASIGADITYEFNNGFSFQAGTNIAGALAQQSPVQMSKAYGMIDRLYLSGNWKMLHLDLGMRPREHELSELSVSGGNVMYSRNARNMPGINAWSDWIYFERGHWFGIKGNISHYQTIDDRYVKGTYIHNKSIAGKFALGRKVDLTIGFEHWAQWGGQSPKYGSQPVSLYDYWRIFMAGKGGEDATVSDRVNVLGNHLGKECVRVDWRHSFFTMTFQYDKPFEDGSGMKFKNAPDGIWSLQFAFNDRDAFVTDVIVEYINTTWQSGPHHDRPATEEEMKKQDPDSFYYGKVVLGGGDDYFSNGEYRSGWTYYNRIIGLPLILPPVPGADGVTMGVTSTRLRGGHVGLKGIIADKVPYAFKATYTRNFGKYNQSETSFFASHPWQLSLALEASAGKRIWKLPLRLTLGVYADIGKVYQNSAGLTLRLDYLGNCRF